MSSTLSELGDPRCLALLPFRTFFLGWDLAALALRFLRGRCSAVEVEEVTWRELVEVEEAQLVEAGLLSVWIRLC